MKTLIEGRRSSQHHPIAKHFTSEEATMTRTYLKEIATEAMMFATSGLFLAWYIWVKVAVWPWGAWSF